jgi:alanyl-tRNA synthetase
LGSKELQKEIDEIHALHEEAEEILLGVESGNLQEFLQEGGGLRDYFLEGRNPADVARELLRQGKKFRGKAAFRLYETFGMPLDFMVDAARDAGIAFDMAGFEAAKEEEQARARASWKGGSQ